MAGNIRASLVSSGGSYAKFFFSSNSGTIYMGSWEKSNPNTYTYEAITSSGVAWDLTKIAATMWDTNNPTNAEIAWNSNKKNARLYFHDGNLIINELVYQSGTWTISGLSSYGFNTTAYPAGLSAISFLSGGVTNIRYVIITPK
ncbi:hypothetical protein ABW20_dc0100368 [Dactylellina cionopaga]|nr:hypothetical protein ABW20_dc0100368 [Dactylellina cionopaga]